MVSFLTSSSALRLCVWLFDDCQLKIFDLYQAFLPAFWAEKRKVYQFCVRSYFDTGFTATGGAAYPFDFFHIASSNLNTYLYIEHRYNENQRGCCLQTPENSRIKVFSIPTSFCSAYILKTGIIRKRNRFLGRTKFFYD